MLATQYFNDDTWNQEKVDTLTIPSIEGYEDSLDDPNMTTVGRGFLQRLQRAAVVRPVPARLCYRGAQGLHECPVWPGEHSPGDWRTA